MRSLIFLIIFLIFLSLVYAQEAKVKLEHVGYGETMKEAYFIVRNTGDVPITDVHVYADEKEVRIIRSKTSPGKGFGFVLYLTAGEHKIDVNTSEGAHDSLTVGVAPVTIKVPTTYDEGVSEEGRPLFGKFRFLIVLCLVVLMLLILYFLLKKPRLRV